MAGETILVVEDSEMVGRMYSDSLVAAGYKVLRASDGLECVSVLRTSPVDLVLLDLVMPRMSGLEALDTMKLDPHTVGIPVVILSNLDQQSDVERGLAAGAADYLVKNTARPADIPEKVAAVLARLA
jgi:CheY-like chemotaxis protein